MVLERGATMSRPRRQAAVQGVKNATSSLSQRQAMPAKGKKNTTKTGRQRRSSAAHTRADGVDASALSEVSSDVEESSNEAESSDEDAAEEESVLSELSEPEYDMDDSGTFGTTSKSKRSSAQRTAKRSSAKSSKRPRKSGGNATAQKRAKTSKATVTRDAPRAARRMANKEDLPINHDNKLFNALRDASDELKTVADDWVAYYIDNAPAALAQFVNCVLRSSGCNETIDEVQVEDTDEAAPLLSQIQNIFKNQAMPSYPLVSRAPAYKRFRRNLDALISHIFDAANEADVLLDDRLLDTLQVWIGSMTSSSYRSFRHTATVYALLFMGQIGRLTQDAREHFGKLIKHRDAEKRKAGAGRAAALDEQVKEVDIARKELEGYFNGLFTAVFQHRFRDSDPTIRIECVEEMGRWMKALPAQFATRQNLVYPGWMLTDPDERVRLAAIHCLVHLYSRRGLRDTLNLFTQRFTPRLLEMATSDIDVGVRVATINLLIHVDKQGAIDDESRDALCAHIFDVEPRVRGAVARFLSDLLESVVEANCDDEAETSQIRFKHFAERMVRLNVIARAGEQDENDAGNAGRDNSLSRMAIAIGEMWNSCQALRDWKPLLALLQLDHTGAEETGRVSGSKRRTSRQHQAQQLSEAYRLEPAEESVLVEALPIFLEKVQQAASSSAGKGQQLVESGEANSATHMTKDLIPVLGQLFNKYRTESTRIRNVLLIPSRMSLGLYLEYQELSAYGQLWDQVVDQFDRHTEAEVLNNALKAIVALCDTTSMSDLNENKLQALRESSVATCKEAAKSVLQAHNEENLQELHTNILHLQCLSRSIDMSAELEDSDDETLTAWDALMDCAKSLGPAEASTTSMCIQVLSLHVMWKTQSLLRLQDSDQKDMQVAALADKRHDLLALLERIVENRHVENDSDLGREAYRELLDIHILFATLQAAPASVPDGMDAQGSVSSPLPEKLKLVCEGSVQDRFATFVEDEIKRHKVVEEDEEESQAPSQVQATLQEQNRTMQSLKRQQALVKAISHYVGAIRLGVVHIRHAVPLLARFGQLGHLFNACLRALFDAIREAGIFHSRSEQACQIIFECIKKSFEGIEENEEQELNFVNLSRQLSSCFLVRGAHLTVLHKMPAKAVVALHERGINFALDEFKTSEEEPCAEAKLVYFKALSNLLVSIGAREAITLKVLLTNALKSRSIAVPSTGKAWDPLRMYEKRLVTIASKSDAFTREHQEQQVSSSPALLGDAGNAEAASSSPAIAATTRPRPRPSSRARQAHISSDNIAAPNEEEDENDVESVLGSRGYGNADDSLVLTRRTSVGTTSALSVPGLDITEEGGLNGSDDDDDDDDDNDGDATATSQVASIKRHQRSRRSRRDASPSTDEDDDDRISTVRTKRARRS